MFFRNNGDLHGVSKSSVSRCIHAVSKALCNNHTLQIKFPSLQIEQNQLKQQFSVKGFPNTLGVIDGTQINILAPVGERERNFVNRKNQHSINCQVICDAQCKIINFVSKWPGNTHDSFIWEQCRICEYFRNSLIDSG